MAHKAIDPSSDLEAVSEALALQLGRDTKILTRLGGGGQGVVYKLYDSATRCYSAAKVVGIKDKAEAGRFEREVRALREVGHPNVMSIEKGPYALTVSNLRDVRFLYYTMPYAELGDLNGLALPGDRRQWYGYLLYILDQVCAGVRAMHERGFVHRDIKPANILFREDRFHPLVADLGLALSMDSQHTWTLSTEKVGTWAYMAPEQESGKAKTAPLSPATDVYALGKLLYFLLTGEEPQPGDLSPEKLKPLSSFSVSLSAYIIGKCTKRVPAERYPDVPSLQRDLQQARANLSLGTYLGPDPQFEAVPRLVILEQQSNADARQALLKTFQGDTRRAAIIRPFQQMTLRIEATTDGMGVGTITNHAEAIFFEEQEYSGTVSITPGGEPDASKVHLTTKGRLDAYTWKAFDKTLVYEMRYKERLRPYRLYKFEYSFNVSQKYGGEPRSIFLPVTDYFGRLTLVVESELALLRARARLFTLGEWQLHHDALDNFFSTFSDMMEPVPDFTAKRVKAVADNPPLGRIFVLWFEFSGPKLQERK